MTVELLTEHNLELLSLKGGCTGSSESTHVKMPNCRKTDVAAHLCSGKLTGPVTMTTITLTLCMLGNFDVLSFADHLKKKKSPK